jgi:integrase
MASITGAEWHLATELVPNRDEMSKVLEMAKATNPRDYVLFALVSHTGLRISEAIHLKADDLVNGKMRVIRRKKRVLQYSSVEISEPIWKLLTEWAQQFDGYLFPGSCKPCVVKRRNGKVDSVPNCSGGHWHIRSAQLTWRMTISRAGLYMHGRGIHQTRHYFATEMYAATKDLRSTQVALAHSSSTMTEKYAHVVDQREKVNLVKAVL